MSDLNELRLARVIDACGGIDGRVKMQKIVYLLRAMGYDLPYDDFRIHLQGPFSRAVACDTDALRGAGILVEEQQEFGTAADGRPIVQYSYRVREEVAQLVRRNFDVASAPGAPALEEIGQELKQKDSAVLEVAATKVFLNQELGLEGEELDEELEHLKGHLSSRFAEADSLLQDLISRRLL